MFTDLLFALRRKGVPIGAEEWLALHRALSIDLIADVEAFYGIGRAILIHHEAHFDAFDQAFHEVFSGVVESDLNAELKRWLADPIAPKELSPEAFARLAGLDLDELRKRFEELLRTQKERHDGGSKWIGTGGTSPFGNGGQNPAGIRVGEGGGRSAVQVASERRFRNYRTDAPLDVRQFQVALRALKNLAREGEEVLDVDASIDETCEQGGEVELVFQPDRRNTVRFVLLMDAGGSMGPHAELVDRLFTAASKANHWKSFHHYFFHNCPYSKVWTDIERARSIQTAKILRDHPPDTKVVFVGDACMAPWELTAVGGSGWYWEKNLESGFDWLLRIRRTFRDSIWLNPEPERYWEHTTISAIAQVFPMFPLTLDGLGRALKKLKHGVGRARAA